MSINRSRAVLAAIVSVALAGCGTSAEGSSPRPAGQRGTTPVASPTRPPDTPAPDAEVPESAAKLATALKEATNSLYKEIDKWDSAAEPPESLVRLALYHQRIYRAMARRTALATATVKRLPKKLAQEARTNTTAIRKLLSLARPISAAKRKKMKIAEPEAAATLRRHMLAAEKKFKVEWEVLAAIMLVETKFGRVRSPSSTGAQGPMQFMPGTWKQYGMGGDVHDTKDAVLAAANYLKATGAPRNYKRAVYAYNHDDRYVDAVLGHARQIKREPRSFFAYYNWQVFVLAKKGSSIRDVRLTGP